MNTQTPDPPKDWWSERWIDPACANSPEPDLLPKHIGSVGGIAQDIGRGLDIYTFAANIHSSTAAMFNSSKPYLWFAISRAGNARYDNGSGVAGDITAGAAYCCFHRADDAVVSYAPGAHLVAGLAIAQDRLALLLENQLLNEPLRGFLSGQFDPMLARLASTPESNTILGQLFSHPYQGVMEGIYLEAKAYELIAENLRLLVDHGTTEGISRARKYASEARDFMMADLGRPPSMADVARHVGLSQRALGNVFHEVYGASPLKCLNAWRLEAAHGLLRSGEFSVKQVSHLLGYAHPSNFSQAFSRQFGRSPTHSHEK